MHLKGAATCSGCTLRKPPRSEYLMLWESGTIAGEGGMCQGRYGVVMRLASDACFACKACPEVRCGAVRERE